MRIYKLITVSVTLFVVCSIPASSITFGDWWGECAARVWDGYCGTVERCCSSKMEQCLKDANSSFDFPATEHSSCWYNYNQTCVIGALLCVDDPNTGN